MTRRIEKSSATKRDDASSVAESAISSVWRERLISILSEDGVTLPRHVPRWRSSANLFARVLAVTSIYSLYWLFTILVMGAIIAKFPSLSGVSLNAIITVEVVAALVPMLFIVYPRVHDLSRRLTMVRAGRTGNPINALRSAKQPPVLYLRSFAFDIVSSKPPFWQQFVMNISGYVAVPHPEMSLALAMPRHTPLLAIGRPGEADTPLGAMRFQVRENRWKGVVSDMTPFCELVIWTTGQSENLRWEIEHLVASVAPTRLLLWLHVRVGRWTPSKRDGEWRRFLNDYKSVFPRSLPDVVGPARFIIFQADWTPVLIPGPDYPPTFMDRINSLFHSWSVLGFRQILARLRQ
jgi:hypothetical protein